MNDPRGRPRFHDSLDALRLLMTTDEYGVIESSLALLLDRLLLGRILTESTFAPVRRMPDVYLAEMDTLISDFARTAGIENYLTPDLQRSIRSLIVRGAAHSARSAPIADSTFVNVALGLLRSGWTQLRCKTCGYLFRPSDLGPARRSLLGGIDLEFGDRIRPERMNDPVKRPILTALQVDHIVPRSSWGPSDHSNLQFLCALCNQGKAIYVAGLEALSVIAAGSYGLHHAIDLYPNRTIFYAALDRMVSRCQICNRDSSVAELTVRPRGDWFTPWTSDVLCYECADEFPYPLPQRRSR